LAFTIPHPADVLEDPADVFPQAQWDRVDIDILAAAVGGKDGVRSGCAVTAQGTPDMTVTVASGTIVVGFVEVAVGSGNVTIPAAHGTLPRFDLIAVNNSGVKSVVQGTAAATPVFPAIPATSVIVAAVYVPAADTAIQTIQIVDKRVTVPALPTASLLITVPKIADEIVNNSSTFQNDDHLSFAVQANKIYHVELALKAEQVSTSAQFKFQWTLPASATVLWNSSPAAVPAWYIFDADGIIATVGLGNSFNGIIKLEGWITVAGTGGTAQLQWAQSTANASDNTLKKGSILRWEEVA
jgi:hypothetical protein